MTNLTVAIATLSDRVPNLPLEHLDEVDGVDYHIFVQGHLTNIPTKWQSSREDVTVTVLGGHGVAHSRNAAIEAVKGDILLFADDDLILNSQSYATLIDLINQHPKVDFFCGQMKDGEGKPFKKYLPHMTIASRWNTARFGTPELAIRVSTVRASSVRFDAQFGAGSKNWLGDEYIFLCDALRSGLKGRHVELVFASHSSPSSGQANSAASFEVRNAVIRRAIGPVSWPVRFAFALRHLRRFPDWHAFLRFVKP